MRSDSSKNWFSTLPPQSGDNGPAGQDDGAEDDVSGGGGGSADDAQNQSANVTDPEAPSRNMLLKPGEEGGEQTLELKLGPDGKPISKELTPAQRNLLDDF